jgi:hypothetical protein
MANFHETYKGLATGPTGIPMRDDDARELEKLLDSGEYSPIRKHSTKAESFSPGERADISVITDESVDGDKQIILAKSIDFSRFQKNPIVTYGHNWYSPPIGKSLWQKKVGNSWKAKTQYASRPDSIDSKDWMPDKIWHLVKSGFLPGKSIGGVAKFRSIEKSDVEQNPEFTGAKEISESVHILEYSVVPIQCNVNAVVQQVAKGEIDLSPEFIHSIPELEQLLKEISDRKEELPRIKNYQTAEEYIASLEREMEEKLRNKCLEAPSIINDMLEVQMGRV